MTTQEYEHLKYKILGPIDANISVDPNRVFQWELLKSIWALTQAIKGGLSE